MSRSSEPSGRHTWNSLDNYFQVHARRMQDFSDEGFVIDDGLLIRRLRPDTLSIRGRIRCQHGLFIDVEKYLAVREIGGRTQVRTTIHSYHAGFKGSRDRGIFRYDNFHAYVREGHADPHHKHVFDHKNWAEITPPVWIGADRWPHLSDVIDELRQWWETTGQHLDLGDRERAAPTTS